jgi:hypothetical protein
MKREDVITTMQDSLAGLLRSGIIETSFTIAEDTVVFGIGSPLDSIGFVTFITDLEERVSNSTGKDIVISLMDMDDFNENEPFLTVKRLADFLTHLANAEGPA